MDGGTVTVTFKGDSKNLDKTTDSIKKNLSNSVGSIKNIIVGTGITQLIGKAFNTLNSNLDGAISRLDTMNNFPKVMKNLGIETSESEKAIKKLSDKLTGLPTALDSAVSGVQRLVSKNGDLDKSTDIFLAMNNAIIAGGGNATIQASAVEQLTQAYSKGKMDMMEWRSIQTAMPAQLKQVATAMNMTTEELGEMLRDSDAGQETMDKFIDTIVRLNSEGIDGFANFEEQARGSIDGIATSVTNFKTAIVRGMANSMDSINTMLGNNGLPSIAQIIQNLTKVVNKGFNTINSAIENSSLSNIASFGELILAVPVLEKFSGLMPILSSGLSKVNAPFNIFSAGFSKLGSMTNMLSSFSSKIGALAPNSKILSMITSGFTKLTGLNGWLSGFNSNLGILIGKMGQLGGLATKISGFAAIGGILIAALGALGPEMSSQLDVMILEVSQKAPELIQNFIDNIISSLPNLIQNGQLILMSLLQGIQQSAPTLIQGLFEILPILSQAFLDMVPDILQTLIILAISVVTSLAQQLPTMIPMVITAILDSILTILDNIDLLIDAGIQLLMGLATGIVNSIPIIVEKAPQIIEKLATGLIRNAPKIINAMKDIGVQMIKGLINGVKNMIPNLLSSIVNIGKSILNGLKNVLGVHSPSTEFAIVGKYSVLGYTEELDDMKKNIQSTVDDVFGISPTMYNNASTHFSPSINMTVVNNVETDPLGQVVNQRKTFSGGAKNDFNYGMGV